MTKSDSRRDLGFAIADAKRLCTQAMDQRMRPLGLSQATWRTLFHLDRHGEGITQRALAEYMGIEGPTLVRLLDNLERSGLVERRPSPTDRRANTLHLTAKARPVLKTINRIAEELRAEFFDGVDEDEIHVVRKVMDRMAENATRAKSEFAIA
ncbi:MAG TPA: MarR family transcriptional regulator [Magnetospirillaceae bacterium]|jgi:MarR family transcriptional regulator for hemolysin